MTTTTGRCLCGEIRYQFDHAPLGIRACWCRDCQYLSGGNASVSAFFRTAGLQLDGEPSSRLATADSGNPLRRRFCPRCGTNLFSQPAGPSDFMAVNVGTLDERNGPGPSQVIWTGSAPDWARFDPDLPRCVAHPATPPPGCG